MHDIKEHETERLNLLSTIQIYADKYLTDEIVFKIIHINTIYLIGKDLKITSPGKPGIYNLREFDHSFLSMVVRNLETDLHFWDKTN